MKILKEMLNDNRFYSALIMLLFALSFISHVSQKKHFNKLHNENFEIKLRRLAPIVQHRFKSENLIRTFVQSHINSWKKIDKTLSASITENFLPIVSSNAKIILLDSSMNLAFNHGLSEEVAEKHTIILKYFFNLILGNRKMELLLENEAKQNLRSLFHSTVNFKQLPNFQNSFTGKHLNKTGMVFLGIIPEKNSTKTVRVSISKTIPREHLKKSNLGAYIIFVPDNAYKTNAWYKSAINLREKKDGITEFAGNSGEISAFLLQTSGNYAATQFTELIRESSSGFFTTVTHGYCFAELKSHDRCNERIFVIHKQPYSQLPVNFSEILFLCLMLTGLLTTILSLYKIDSNGFNWKQSIKSKFLILSIFSCIFPLAGLYYQESTNSSLAKIVHEEKIYTKLEKKFSELENEIQIELANILSNMQLFKDFYSEHSDTNYRKYLKMVGDIGENSISFVIICEPGGAQKIICTDVNDIDNINDSTRLILTSLATLIIENSNLKNFLTSDEKKNYKSSIMLETITEAFPKGQFYQSSIKTRELLPYKLGQKSVWVYSDFDYSDSYEPQRLYLMIVDRNKIIRRIIDFFQKTQNQRQPEFLFLNRIISTALLAPNWVENKSRFIDFLEIANQEGEILKHSENFAGEKVYLYGRKLKNQDWAAIATHFETESAPARMSKAAVFSITYIILILGILIVAFQKFFTSPIRQIRNAVQQMSDGKYETRLAISGNDELSKLCESFNEMSNELKEKDFLNRFLSNIAREAIAGDKTTRGAKIEATILFSDIRSFTTLSEQYLPEEIVEMLNDYMTDMEMVIEKYSGSIEKFIGDAIMAVFLPELGKPDAAIRATLAAKEMVVVLDNFNIQRKMNSKFTISNGVGIATGDLLMGTLGSIKGRKDYTVTGVTVNQAAEMEKLSKQTSILPIVFCENTANRLANTKIKVKRMKSGNDNKCFELAEP